MPIREYECTICHYIEEEITSSLKEPEELICPVCEGMMIKIAISSSSVHFKGYGWPGSDSIKQRQRWYDSK